MTGHEEFIRAIVENPDNDGLRLNYADWLEERGQGTEAETIRNTVAGKFEPERSYGDNAKFADLKGKTIASINGKVGADEITITLVSGEKYKMYYEPD